MREVVHHCAPMRSIFTGAASRLAAALVALALTGLPGQVAAARPQRAEHDCACKAHRGERACHCPGCRQGSPPGHADRTCFGPACRTPELPAPPPSGVERFTLPASSAEGPAPERREAIPRADLRAPVVPRAPETPPPRTA